MSSDRFFDIEVRFGYKTGAHFSLESERQIFGANPKLKYGSLHDTCPAPLVCKHQVLV